MTSLLLLAVLPRTSLPSDVVPQQTGKDGGVWTHFIERADDMGSHREQWRVVPVAPDDRRPLREAIGKAVRIYPAGLIERNVLIVYLASQLEFEGTAIGGTNRPDVGVVFLAAAGDGAADAKRVRRGFHHELAHVCLGRHPDLFPKEAWLKENPKDYRYPASNGFEALTDGATSGTDAQARQEGFARAYGRVSFEEDVATVAEMILSGDETLRGIPRGATRLRRKCELLISFYAKLDSAFKPPEAWSGLAQESQKGTSKAYNL